MQFNASQFRAKLNGDITSPAYFNVKIAGVPNILKGKTIFLSEAFSFRIYQTELVGKHVEHISRTINGATRHIPYGVLYSSIGISVIEDQNLTVRNFFDAWHYEIFNPENSYTIPYYDDIIIPELDIITYKKDGTVGYTQRCFDVYPLDVGAARLSWEAQNQVMVTNIQLAIRESISIS